MDLPHRDRRFRRPLVLDQERVGVGELAEDQFGRAQIAIERPRCHRLQQNREEPPEVDAATPLRTAQPSGSSPVTRRNPRYRQHVRSGRSEKI